MTDPQDGTPGERVPGPIVDATVPEAPAPAELQAFPEPTPASEGIPPTLLTGVTPEPPPSASPPTFRFFGIVAAISLIADVSTKAWAEITLSHRNPLEPTIVVIKDHLAFALAYNKGGAWGLFQNQPEYVRRPFFLLVSLLAIAFIINLYGRLQRGQKALTWGLPLVLGGALGNLSDRIVRSNVIDFVDYQASWIEKMNTLIAKVVKGWAITDHWPTFNVADIAICVGVGLMAVDMFTSRRGASASIPPRPPRSRPPAPLTAVTGPEAGVPPSALSVPEVTPPLKPEA
jgi:lipoprotein signal peptidase